MAPPAKAVNPPSTLPADFFDNQGGAPATLPANFFDADANVAHRVELQRALENAPAPAEKQPQGFWASAGRQIGNVLSAPHQLVKAFTEGPQNPEEAALQKQPVTGIMDLGLHRLVTEPMENEAHKAASEFKQANAESPWYSFNPTPKAVEHRELALGHGLAAAIPVLGPAAANTGEMMGKQIASGDTAGGIGTGVGFGASLALPKYGAKALGATMDFGAKVGEPYKSPAIPPSEAESLRIAKAVQPPIMRTYRENLQSELPAIRSFAEEHGNPLNSQPELAKAASDAANEHWKQAYDPLVEPIRLNRVNIAGEPGMRDVFGRSHASATVNEIENRLAEINRLTGPAYKIKDPTQSAAALERAAQLNEEAHQLRQILYDEVGKANNLDPQLVRAIRERGGRLNSIGEDTTQAVEDRAKGVGRSEEGQPFVLPINSGMLGTVREIGTKIRGGREAVADSALRKALNPPTPYVRNGVRAIANVPKTVGNMPDLVPALMGRLRQEKKDQK